MSFCKWLTRLASGKPHLRIGEVERPYLLRWYLIPQNPWLNVYLHKFLRDDDDRALHDHPWWFISFMLKGRYNETMQLMRGYVTRSRSFPSIAYRPAETRHCITLDKDEQGNPIPAWTLVITGPKSREWGFWCPRGFVHWTLYVARDDEGNVGKGCGE